MSHPYGPTVNVNSTNDPISSNGGTAVDLCAAAAGKQVYCSGALVIHNSSASANHVAQLLSSGGRVIAQFPIAAGQAVSVEDRGDYVTAVGEGLQFKFTDGGGSAADLKATGTVVQR